MSREKWLPRLREVFEGRGVVWDDRLVGVGVAGARHHLSVFNADAHDQRPLLARFRALRPEIEADLGGPVVVIFHTTTETERLYAGVARSGSTDDKEESARLTDAEVDELADNAKIAWPNDLLSRALAELRASPREAARWLVKRANKIADEIEITLAAIGFLTDAEIDQILAEDDEKKETTS